MEVIEVWVGKMSIGVLVWVLYLCFGFVAAQVVTLAGNNYATHDCETPLHWFLMMSVMMFWLLFMCFS